MRQSKLTLQVLSAYLPYGVKMYDTIYQMSRPLIGDSVQRFMTLGIFPESEKLLLRPLSDLTDEQIFELDGLHDFSIMIFKQIKENPMRYPYVIVQKLLEWHFDIFGLIDSGDALPLTNHAK